MQLLQWLFPEKRAKLAAAKQALADADNLRGVGVLTEALWSVDAETRRQVERALIHLLPRLRDTDAGLLNVDQRRCLNRALEDKHADVALKLAILKALEAVGDGTSLPYVERLIAEPSKTTAKEQVKNAALECLPFLQARVLTMQVTQQLLRSSDRPAVSLDALRQPDREKEKV